MAGLDGRRVDLPLTVLNQGLYEESETAKHRVGDFFFWGENKYVYSYFVAASTAGFICGPDQSLIGSNNLLADGSCVDLAVGLSDAPGQPAITAVLVAGDTWLAVSHASSLDNVVKDVLKNGWLTLTDSDDIDQMHRIKSNSAIYDQGTTDVVAIELYDPLVTATSDTNTGIQFMINQYNQLRPSIFNTDDGVSGVPLFAITADRFAWLQTEGIAMCVTVTDTEFAGFNVELSGTGLVAVKDQDGTEVEIGIGMSDVTTAGDSVLVKLQLA